MPYLGSRVNSVGLAATLYAVAFSDLYTPEDIKKLQNDDPAIGPVLQAVESGNYPPEDFLKSWSLEGRSLRNSPKCSRC